MIKKLIKKTKDSTKIVESIVQVKDTHKLSEFNVYDSNGVFIRKFSNEIHGELAKELSEKFALKINGEVK